MRRWQLIYDVCGRETKLWRRDQRGRLQEVALEIERTPNISVERMAAGGTGLPTRLSRVRRHRSPLRSVAIRT
jgi:hypothetical protein